MKDTVLEICCQCLLALQGEHGKKDDMRETESYGVFDDRCGTYTMIGPVILLRITWRWDTHSRRILRSTVKPSWTAFANHRASIEYSNIL